MSASNTDHDAYTRMDSSDSERNIEISEVPESQESVLVMDIPSPAADIEDPDSASDEQLVAAEESLRHEQCEEALRIVEEDGKWTHELSENVSIQQNEE